jgi:hypothetical protein
MHIGFVKQVRRNMTEVNTYGRMEAMEVEVASL